MDLFRRQFPAALISLATVILCSVTATGSSTSRVKSAKEMRAAKSAEQKCSFKNVQKYMAVNALNEELTVHLFEVSTQASKMPVMLKSYLVSGDLVRTGQTREFKTIGKFICLEHLSESGVSTQGWMQADELISLNSLLSTQEESSSAAAAPKGAPTAAPKGAAESARSGAPNAGEKAKVTEFLKALPGPSLPAGPFHLNTKQKLFALSKVGNERSLTFQNLTNSSSATVTIQDRIAHFISQKNPTVSRCDLDFYIFNNAIIVAEANHAATPSCAPGTQGAGAAGVYSL